jgi:hypothetical protein
MKVRIEIDMENDAFRPPGRMRELKRVMDTAREHVAELWLQVKGRKVGADKKLMDINGNSVGFVSVEP